MAGIMIKSANGIDDSIVVSETEEAKGISNEITLNHDVISKVELWEHLQFLSEKVGRRVRMSEKYASVVGIILKDKYFKRFSRQRKLENPTNNSDEIFQVTKELLDELGDIEPIRLIGVRLDKLRDQTNYQVSLFEDVTKKDYNETQKKSIVNKIARMQLNNLSEITTALGTIYDKRNLAEGKSTVNTDINIKMDKKVEELSQ